MEGETVYNSHDDSHIVMSEKVQSLAGNIYQEFERMIQKYDENVVKDLMPLVVNILECLDLAYTENQEHEVEVELLREDNEQLVTQYEREKQLRKASEQKLLELEDCIEEDRKQCQTKIESLESIVRMFELKTRNASDHANRMEDKVEELKKEYSKLHERYTDLFKTHMDYMERTKILCGTDRLDQLGMARPRLPGIGISNLNRSSGLVSFGFSSLDPNKSLGSPIDFESSSDHLQTSCLKSELQEAQVGPDTPIIHTDKEQITDRIQQTERSTATRGGWVDGFSPESEDMEQSSPELEDIEDLSIDTRAPNFGKPVKLDRQSTSTTKEERTGNTLYQELHFQEPDLLAEVDEGADITVTDNFFGMGKEVENLIMENTELLATKNALNIVKDDLIAKVDELTSEQEILKEEINSLNTVKSRLRLRVQELEEEIKKQKDEFEKSSKASNLKSDDEEDVPMAQRKRFTRVEMARVLMERNQYKERFMELQEAVRWTEMIRASKGDPESGKKDRQTIWKFFSNLFSTSERPHPKPLPYPNMRYNAPNHHVTPAIDTMRKRNNASDSRRRGMDFLESEFVSSEKLQQRRAYERREQYKQVRAHVKKDDGRMQAYGWSLPAKTPPLHPQSEKKSESNDSFQNLNLKGNSNVPVPVPVYCRPLMEKEPGMKIWCAAGVNLTGGRTKDGGNIVGASVFYNSDSLKKRTSLEEKDNVEDLNEELRENEQTRRDHENLDQKLSSLVWICTSTHSISKVTVIDANNPADILESFHVCSSHLLCISSVPGVKESDYSSDDCDILKNENQNLVKSEDSDPSMHSSEGGHKRRESSGSIGTLTFISCGTGGKTDSPVASQTSLDNENEQINPVLRREVIHSTDPESDSDRSQLEASNCEPPVRRLLKTPKGVIKDGMEEDHLPLAENCVAREEVEKMSSVLATMWLGSQNGSIYVHSAVRHWKRCLHSIKLNDSVLSIVHIKGRVLAALADGSIAIFHRKEDGQWDLHNYHLLDLGRPHHSIRCMHVVHNKVWCGYRNKIHVINPQTMLVQNSFDAHPRKESQVRQMAWIGDGVWVSIRLDSTLRLYHAHTYNHLQDVDIEPYVSKMLGTGKLGFSFVRITALLISCNRLWIGTGNGVIISVPLSDSANPKYFTPSSLPSMTLSSENNSLSSTRIPGSIVRVYADSQDQIAPGSYIPYCSMALAQLSFHGHRDAVKFFVSVPGLGGYSTFTEANCTLSDPSSFQITNVEDAAAAVEGALSNKDPNKTKNMLILSGGEGYIDFRIGDGEEDVDPEASQMSSLSKGDWSHLIVWSIGR